MPADTNPYGGVFGGWLMSQMALAAGSLASRHSGGKAVVVAADELRFPGAPQVGDEISIYRRAGEAGPHVDDHRGRSDRRGNATAISEIKVASGRIHLRRAR